MEEISDGGVKFLQRWNFSTCCRGCKRHLVLTSQTEIPKLALLKLLPAFTPPHPPPQPHHYRQHLLCHFASLLTC